MELQITLLLLSVFFRAHAFQCLECIPDEYGTCTDELINCSSQCASRTTTIYLGDQELSSFEDKSCIDLESCTNVSVNLGVVQKTANIHCCSDDNCNNHTVSDLPKESDNGRSCFTCYGMDCSKTMKCVGIEDRCVTATMTSGGQRITMKGCASRNFCDGPPVTQKLNASIHDDIDVTCCEESLCNTSSGADNVGQAMLFVLVSTIPALLFF